jgi:hypothetical protein
MSKNHLLVKWLIENFNRKVRDILSESADFDTQIQNIANVTADLLQILTDVQADLANSLSPAQAAKLDSTVSALQAADASLRAAVPPAAGGGSGVGNAITVANPGSLTSSIAAGAVSLQLSATDSDPTQTPSLTATGLPDGLSMDDTGLVTGTPTTVEVNTVEVTGEDMTGATGTTTFTWTITA